MLVGNRVVAVTFCFNLGSSQKHYSKFHLWLHLFSPSHNNVFNVKKLIWNLGGLIFLVSLNHLFGNYLALAFTAGRGQNVYILFQNRKQSLKNEECRLLGCDVVYILCEPTFGGKYLLHLQGRKIHERGTSVSRWLHNEPLVENNWSHCKKRNACKVLVRKTVCRRTFRVPKFNLHIDIKEMVSCCFYWTTGFTGSVSWLSCLRQWNFSFW
jgi:hypothetical protein